MSDTNASKSLLAEQAILGALIAKGSAWDDVADKININHFSVDYHKKIFQAMLSLSGKDKPIDIITLDDELRELGIWDDTSAIAYAGELAKNSPSTANLAHYADILVKHETIRRLEFTATKISMLAGDQELQPSEMVDKAEGMIYEIQVASVRGGGPKPISEPMSEFLELLEQKTLPVLATGYVDLDKITAGGLRPGELIILAGRPGSGKTTLGMGIAQHAAVKLDKKVLVFSMEMTPTALVSRMFASLAQVDANDIRAGKLQQHEYDRVYSMIGVLGKDNIYIDGTPNLKPSELRARARRNKRERPDLALILVDYIQLMSADTKYDNRVYELGEISGSLKSLAKELNLPVIALAQLNRNSVKGTESRKPTMADLRDSGSLEQDADMVGLIYRESLHEKELGASDKAELIIDKQRNGETGIVPLIFDGRFNRFLSADIYHS